MLSYLNERDLSCTESTCSSLRALFRSHHVWEDLDRRCSSSRVVGNSVATLARDRSCRYFRASLYAQLMEKLAPPHFDNDRYGPLFNRTTRRYYDDKHMYPYINDSSRRCRDCNCFPDINTGAVSRGQQNLVEYYVRLSYREAYWHGIRDIHIWEGFVDASDDDDVEDSDIFLEMQHIYPHMRWDWMEDYLRLHKTHCYPAYAEQHRTIENLQVTIVALERNYPWHASLVISTSGAAENEWRAGVMNSRNIRSHPTNTQEEEVLGKIGVEVLTVGDPGTSEEPYFRGLRVSDLR